MQARKESRRRKPMQQFPKAGANFPAGIFLAGQCPNLCRDSISCCRKKNAMSSRTFAGNSFQQGMSHSHSLLEFSGSLRSKRPLTGVSGPSGPECTKIARLAAVAAGDFYGSPQNRAIFRAPNARSPCDQKSLANGAFLCNSKKTKQIPTVEFPSLR